MTLARTIAPHLPYLRRFARALEGAQAGGDAFVAATLEALIADPASFPSGVSPKVGLYRVFVKLWSSAHAQDKPVRSGALEDALQRNLEALTPASRQAFLLRTVEDFPVDDVASILGVDADTTIALLDAAGREIAEQVATSVLIIEDEPIIALDIESLVRDLGHEVTGVARTHREAVDMVKARQPGLVLADIQLADGSSGLDAVNEILTTIDTPVIFITAFPERLLTGEKPEPAFLVTKPFRPETVKATISQALFFDRKAGRKAT
jgi:CheY-like chemotaxis protein/DNA-directed RNA polymerase specialized sigma24 family protein